MKQVLTTGVIKSPHGIKGYLKVHPFADDFSHFFSLSSIVASKNGKEKNLEIEQVQSYNGELLVKFKGIDTPEDAKLLSGWDLLVPRSQASKLENGEIYSADLVGMKLVYFNEETGEKEELGSVISVMEGAQALLMEVRCNDLKNRIVPFIRGIFVDDIDVENGSMKILKKELVQ